MQTGRPHTENRATQTEAEALPLHAPPLARQLAHLILNLATASIVLAGLAAVPGAYAHPLAAIENLPSSTTGLLRAIAATSLVLTAGKFLVTHVAAAVTDIPDLPEPTAVAATAFIAAIAAGYLLVRRPRPETEEAIEVIKRDDGV